MASSGPRGAARGVDVNLVSGSHGLVPDERFSSDSELMFERLRCLDDLVARVERLEQQVGAGPMMMEPENDAVPEMPPATVPPQFPPSRLPQKRSSNATFEEAAQEQETEDSEKEPKPDLRQMSSSRSVRSRTRSGSRLDRRNSSGSRLSRGSTYFREHNEHMSQALDEHNRHKVAATTWEVGPYVGLPFLHTGAHVSVGALFILNLLIQAVFCIIIADSFFEGDLNMTPEKAAKFRQELGHDYRNMDVHGWVSLTARVCDFDQSLEIATEQVRTVGLIGEYTKKNQYLLDMPSGAVLCTVVLCVWVLTMVKDIREAVSLHVAMSALPRGKRTVLEVSGEQFRLVSISRRRFFIVWACTVIRIAVTIGLMVFGGIYLARTTEIEDLILNTAALGFILEVDELLFRTLAPLQVQTLIASLDPIPKPVGCLWSGVGPMSVGSLIFSVISVGIFVSLVTMDTLDRLHDIEKELCGKGPHDFIVRLTSGGEVIMGTTRPIDDPYTKPALEAVVVRETINSNDPYNNPISRHLDSDRWAFTAITERMTVEATMRRLSGIPCTDIAGNTFSDSAAWRQVSYRLGAGTEMTCADFFPHCDEAEQNWLRTLCSATCQCNIAQSGNLYKGVESGCLPQCDRELIEAEENRSCEDIPASDFSDNSSAVIRLLNKALLEPQFHSWMDAEEKIFLNEVFGEDRETIMNTILTKGEEEGGCFFMYSLPSFCLFGGAAFCPSACLCMYINIVDCPPSCKLEGVSLSDLDDDEEEEEE